LAKVIADAVATIQPAADAKGIRIESVIDPKVDRLSGDPERLQQVVWNLISNAVKFTPRDGRIQVRLISATSQVELVISDTGIGIPAAFLPHIFERFRQAEGGTTRRHGGLGLGLAIARHLVEMHGGTIDAASPGENQGATFSIRLPVAGMHHEAQAEDDRPHPRGPQAGSVIALQDLSGVRVLAVDDDEDALMMLRQILENAGATVETALSGERALEILAAGRRDVMIADLGMPVMDGFDLIRLVRQSNEPGIRNVAAAALTAYARSEDRAKALRAGFDLHLAKPVDPGDLVAAVAALARNRPQRVS
jgi:CheY-like chemotaxis protein